MLVVELAALGIAVVTLLLDRLDHRREEIRRRPDVGQALADLHRVVSGWAVAARDVNGVYEDWLDRGADGPVDDFDALTAQAAYMKVFDNLVGGWQDAAPGERPPPALGVLEVYAPELRESLQAVAKNRLEQHAAVYALMQDYAQNVTGPDARKLNRTAAELAQTAEELRRFIMDNFPAQTL